MKNKESQLVFGIHSLSEAINAGNEINKVFIRKGIQSEQFTDLFRKIQEYGIPYQFVPVEKLNRMINGNHQGVVAQISLIEYKNLEEIIQRTFEDGRDPFIIVLDGVTDVRNFGAIARTAECAGADAILVPARRSVSITPDALKTSAGALTRIAVSRSNNMNTTLTYLKESGIRIVAASEKSDNNYFSADLTGPIALLMGSEDTGISKALMDFVDASLSISMKGAIGSLNVSVAFGIIAFEIVRQRHLLK